MTAHTYIAKIDVYVDDQTVVEMPVTVHYDWTAGDPATVTNDPYLYDPGSGDDIAVSCITRPAGLIVDPEISAIVRRWTDSEDGRQTLSRNAGGNP